MFSNAPLSQFEELTQSFLADEIPQTLLTSFLTWAAILLFTVGTGLFVFSVLRNKPAYVSDRMTKKTPHYVLCALGPALAVLQFFAGPVSGTAAILFAVASVLVALIGAVALLMRRKLGLVFSALGVWLSLPVKEAPKVAAVLADVRTLDAYNAASKLAVWSADRMILSRITAFALIAAAVTLCYVAVYTRRRYLFRSTYDCWFADVSVCPACGAPLVCEDPFCPACGENVAALPRSVLRWAPLDEPRFCGNCGRALNRNGDCLNCAPQEAVGSIVKERLGGGASGKLKYLICVVLVAVFVFLPVLRGDSIKKLTRGDLQINDAYVAKLNEWSKAPELAEDEAWLAGYDDAAAALSRLNAGLFDANPDRMSYSEIYGYVQYVEATYKQMAVVQKLNEAVHASDVSAVSDLGAYYNASLKLQQQALVQQLRLTVSTSGIQAGQNMVLDSLRFYLSFIPAWALVVGFALLGVVLLLTGVVLLLRRRDASPFLQESVAAVSTEEARIRAEKRRALLKEERKVTALGILGAVLILGVSFAISSVVTAKSAPEVEVSMHSAFTSNGAALTEWIANCAADPEKARADADEAARVMENTVSALDAILSSGDAEAEVVAVAEPLRAVLSDVRADLHEGKLPDDRTRKTLSALLLQGMKLDAENLINEAFDSLDDLF